MCIQIIRDPFFEGLTPVLHAIVPFPFCLFFLPVIIPFLFAHLHTELELDIGCQVVGYGLHVGLCATDMVMAGIQVKFTVAD